MKKQTMSMAKIREIGLNALVRALGEIDMVRFLQQFEIGRGDYTKKRNKWLNGMDINTIVSEIKERRKHQ